MADDKHGLNQGKNMESGNRGDQGAQGGSQKAPGRDANENLSMGDREGGRQNPNNPNKESGFDREDREREQPGSKQHDQGKR